LAANLPDNSRHQFLPLDAPKYLEKFLDHWRPSLSVWAEQDLWPGAVVVAARRGIPLAMVNARMGPEGYARRARMRGLFADLFAHFRLVCAQDAATAERLAALGARAVQVTGSLKPSAPVLAFDLATLKAAQAKVAGRRVWVAASTHDGDEREAIEAQAALYADDPAWLLILVPRVLDRAEAVAQALHRARLGHVRRSHGGWPDAADAVWLADSFGELGLWYRLADRALVGGGFDGVGGHNPWEAAALGTAVYHGQDVRNFAADYQTLDTAGAAKVVDTGELAKALGDDPTAMVAAGRRQVALARSALDPLAAELLGLMSKP
jgi:3-deoxy-D-manno-octulosonic-acid transferase